MSSKQDDPGVFFVKCVIGDCVFKDALADLGASVNIMPSHIYEKLNLPCIAPTPLVVRLPNGTTHYPRGLVANVLIKVGRNLVPIDFMVLDVGKYLEVPMILGRPFLATCCALIDVGTGKLIFRINGEQVDENQVEKKEHVCSVITKRAKKKVRPWWEIRKVSWVPKCLKTNNFEGE
ncbi:PREDICTED: uncharacterized protein LOC109155281 [Ipomoea nil]|uniref:uncharacterized protein LOC109155281 n=1 Tax=Ipomoea nil TaxID=35883 RepID=UPI000901A34F|nr:PREDICTED: uncharacterized protein LOC109155281 [Ipomoea nil]